MMRQDSSEDGETRSPDVLTSLRHPRRSGQKEDSMVKQHGRDMSAPSLVSFGTGQESSMTTPGGRRQAVRQLFDRHDISRPSGWLSDEDDDMLLEGGLSARHRKSRRVCHVCGDKIMPQAFCPSCGHPLCGECRRLTNIPAHAASVVLESHQAPGNFRATGPASPDAAPSKIFEGKRRTEQPSKSLADTTGIEKRGSVKNNPFFIADRIAKAKVAEPQTSAANIQSAPTSKPPKYNVAPQPQHAPDVAQHGRWGEQLEGHVEKPMTKPSRVNKSEDFPQSRMTYVPQDILASTDQLPAHGVMAPSESTMTMGSDMSPKGFAAESLPEKITLPAFRRVRVLAREPSSGNLEGVLQVDVEGSGRDVPRVRVSSPPSWLKHPTRMPGSIDGRLRRVASGGGPLLSRQSEFNDASAGRARTPPAKPKAQAPSAAQQDEEKESGKSRASVLLKEIRKTQSKASISRQAAVTAPSAANPHRESTVSPASSAVATARVSNTGIHPGPIVPTTSQRHYTWSTQQLGNLATEMRRSEPEIPPKPASELQADGSEIISNHDSGRQEDDGDVGIQGLTIVLHMKGKDDLVISTDLTRDAQSF